MDQNTKELQATKYKVDRLEELHRNKQFHKFQLAVFNAIFRDGYKRIFIRKGRKGGGTECVMYPVARVIGTTPNASAYIIGPTQKGQSEIIWDNRRIHRFLPKEWGGAPNEKDKRIRLNNGSFVKIEGADDPDAARGWEGDIFVWDEYKDHNPLSMEACFPNVMARDGIWIVLGTPPTKKTNHYYLKEQEIRNDPDWRFFHWTSWDNPFLPGGHDLLKKEKEKYIRRGDWDIWEIEYEARYVFNANRKVVPNFNDKNKKARAQLLTELSRDKSHLKWVAAIDPGYATCFAVVFAAFNPYTNQLYILDEIYSTDRKENSVRDMWPLIRKKQRQLYEGRWFTLYDSAALAFATEVYANSRDSGDRVSLIPTKKGKSDEDNYFRVMNGVFAERGQAYVAEECINTIREIEDYETDEKDDYPDEHNHTLDGIRYILKFLNISDVLKQGEVITVNTLPKATSIEDYEREERNKVDMIGFGGADANFSVINDTKGWTLW